MAGIMQSMTISKETSFWGKWNRKKELKAGKEVWLSAPLEAAGGFTTIDVISPLSYKKVKVESERTVMLEIRDGFAESKADTYKREKYSGAEINEAKLETQGFLSLVGIKSKVVYEYGNDSI